MRIYFQSIDRAKGCAKLLAWSVDGLKLSIAQETLAKLAGYRDWHDLAGNLHQELNGNQVSAQRDSQSQENIIALVLDLSERLDLTFGDALYAIAQTRLPGIRIEDHKVYESVWLQIFSETQPLAGRKRSPGTVIKIKSLGRTGERAILKTYGKPTYLITHKHPNSMVADFEVVFPRKPLPLFFPSRLKLAYGSWTEKDGSKVLFSRDYKPLWRLRVGRKPERLQPWLWIKWIEYQHFWDDRNTPWWSFHRLEEEEQRLLDFGIWSLPKLADTLPDLLFNKNLRNVDDAVKLMAGREQAI